MQPTLGLTVSPSSGTVQVTVAALGRQDLSIQTSTNLAQWLTITNVTLVNGTGQFVDATTFPRRFYRALVP
jgi:hypothetical protein